MASAGTIVIDLSANSAQFINDMDRAASMAQRSMKQMERDAKMVGAAMGAMVVSTAGALAIMVKQSIDGADSLRDLAQMTGIAVETLNGIGFAASQAGGSLDGIVAAAGKLNKSIAEAAKGNNEQADAFKALGINVQDASGKLKTADVVMAEIADKFATYADGPEKVAIAIALMGRAAWNQIPVLNDGGDAMRANIAYAKQYSGVTVDLANASDEFNDTMGKLHMQQKGFANTLTAAVLPVLQAIADETLQAAEESNGFNAASGAVRTVLETMVVVGSEVAFVFKGVGTEIGGIAAQIAALGRGDFKGFSAIGDAMKADAERARAEHDAFIARVMNRTPATVTPDGVPTGSKPPAPRLPNRAVADAQKKLIDEGKALAISLRAQDNGLSGDYYKKWDSLALAYKAGAINLDLLTTAQAELLKQQPLMKASAAEKVKADIDGFKAMDELRKAAEAEEQRNIRSVDQINISLMNEVDRENLAYATRMEALQKYHDAKLENVQRADALIEQEIARHQQALFEIQPLQHVFMNAFKGMEDSIAAFARTGKLSFSNMIDSMIADLIRFQIQQSITIPLMKALGSGNVSTGLMGWLGITTPGSNSAGYAGVLNNPSAYVATPLAVGTNYVPFDGFKAILHKGEAVIPAAYNPAAGGRRNTSPVVININATVGNVASQIDVVQGMQIVRQQIRQEFQRMDRYGGAAA